MKKDRKKIFGIGAAVLVLLLAITPVMGGLSLNETVKTNDSDFIAMEKKQLSASEETVYKPYTGQEDIKMEPGMVYYDPDHVIVGCANHFIAEAIARGTGCIFEDWLDELRAALFKMTGSWTTDTFIEYVEEHWGWTDVEYAEVNAMCGTLFTPNDPRWDDQWGPQAINCPAAWDTTLGSTDVVIAVLDTGFCHLHQDGAYSMMWGRDFVEKDWDPQDENGHGTHCAGIAAAKINNNVGIAGVSKSAILVVRVLDKNGYGSVWNIAKAIIWATDNDQGDAWIISMSLGITSPRMLLKLACDYAYYTKKVLIVAASGNEVANKPIYPAGYNSVIAVGAVKSNLNLASFSNRGNELVAPGVNILSLKKGTTNGYKECDGTSMACPHVAGVAALCLAEIGEKKPYEVRAILTENAIDLGASGHDSTYGYGLVDAAASVNNACPLEVSSEQEAVSNPLTNLVFRLLSRTQKIFNSLPYVWC